jgi:hypothetical protein
VLPPVTLYADCDMVSATQKLFTVSESTTESPRVANDDGAEASRAGQPRLSMDFEPPSATDGHKQARSL